MFLDDSACNLASINLVKFIREDGGFDLEGFVHAARIYLSRRKFSSTAQATRRKRSR
jgi:hypothetical protein